MSYVYNMIREIFDNVLIGIVTVIGISLGCLEAVIEIFRAKKIK